MSDKLMWLEGMVLSPHHFQQAESLQTQENNFRLKLLNPFNYGLASLDLDREALESGFFALKDCSGVFPDGTAFAFPAQDGHLDQRPFESNFTAAKDNLGVYLGTPALAQGNPNFTAEGATEGRPTRYLGQNREVPDINSGSGNRPIVFGRLNLRILFEGESTSGLQTLKIAVLKRDAQGRIRCDEDFIPTSLRLSASLSLLSRLKKLADGTTQKSGWFMAQRSQKATGVAQFSAESLTQYLLLSALNTSLPDLQHFLQQPSVHPETVYRRLIAFAGSLISFGADGKISDFPPYLHGDLSATFHPLFQLLENLLGVGVPTGFRMVSLAKTSPVQYLANFKDLDMSKVREFYLGVSAQAGEVEIITAIQRKAKMGPAAKLETLVSHALPGLPLLPEPQPPQGVPTKAGFKYFRVHQTGELWDSVKEGKSLALHVPGDLPSPKLELIVTLES